MKRMLTILTCLLSFAPGLAWAQEDRFELGQRLRAFEQSWESHTDREDRKRAAAHLKQAFWIPFSIQPGKAGQMFDRARFALESPQPPSPERAWAASLAFQPSQRLVDLQAKKIDLKLRHFYPVPGKLPKDASLHVSLRDAKGKDLQPVWNTPVSTVPWNGVLNLNGVPEGDHRLEVEICVAGKTLMSRWLTLSFMSEPARRLEEVQQVLDRLGTAATGTHWESVRQNVMLLTQLLGSRGLETNYPGVRLLREVESAAGILASGKSYYGKDRPGEFWMRLSAGKQAVPVRLMAPPAVAKGKPLPLVVALHGASGSENLFFDGYGRGAIVRKCQERKWLLVSPRLAFGKQLPVWEMVKELARIYPVAERQVFLVGHSMGAAQAVNSAVRTPERFAAVAALGGGSLTKATEALRPLPFFVGVGSEDFALAWARRLNKNLLRAGVRQVQFREYKGVEHVAIVQEALGDVFTWLDGIAKRPTNDSE